MVSEEQVAPTRSLPNGNDFEQAAVRDSMRRRVRQDRTLHQESPRPLLLTQYQVERCPGDVASLGWTARAQQQHKVKEAEGACHFRVGVDIEGRNGDSQVGFWKRSIGSERGKGRDDGFLLQARLSSPTMKPCRKPNLVIARDEDGPSSRGQRNRLVMLDR